MSNLDVFVKHLGVFVNQDQFLDQNINNTKKIISDTNTKVTTLLQESNGTFNAVSAQIKSVRLDDLIDHKLTNGNSHVNEFTHVVATSKAFYDHTENVTQLKKTLNQEINDLIKFRVERSKFRQGLLVMVIILGAIGAFGGYFLWRNITAQNYFNVAKVALSNQDNNAFEVALANLNQTDPSYSQSEVAGLKKQMDKQKLDMAEKTRNARLAELFNILQDSLSKNDRNKFNAALSEISYLDSSYRKNDIQKIMLEATSKKLFLFVTDLSITAKEENTNGSTTVMMIKKLQSIEGTNRIRLIVSLTGSGVAPAPKTYARNDNFLSERRAVHIKGRNFFIVADKYGGFFNNNVGGGEPNDIDMKQNTSEGWIEFPNGASEILQSGCFEFHYGFIFNFVNICPKF